MRVVSLFSGAGGLDYGLHQAGHTIILQCECDPSAQQVLKSAFPKVALIPTVEEILQLPKDTELLAAGFPCVDISSAGNRAGIYGKCSGLVHHVFRLLRRAVERHRPVPWVLLENVEALLDRGRDQSPPAVQFLVDELEGLGYRSWAQRVICSAGFGIPNQRRRVFVLASMYGDARDVLLAQGQYRCQGQCRVQDQPRSCCYECYRDRLEAGKFRHRECTYAVDMGNARSSPCLDVAPTFTTQNHRLLLMFPDGRCGMMKMEDAERLQGLPPGHTLPCYPITGPGINQHRKYQQLKDKDVVKREVARYPLIGNAVTAQVAQWLGERLMRLYEFKYYRSENEVALPRWFQSPCLTASEREAIYEMNQMSMNGMLIRATHQGNKTKKDPGDQKTLGSPEGKQESMLDVCPLSPSHNHQDQLTPAVKVNDIIANASDELIPRREEGPAKGDKGLGDNDEHVDPELAQLLAPFLAPDTHVYPLRRTTQRQKYTAQWGTGPLSHHQELPQTVQPSAQTSSGSTLTPPGTSAPPGPDLPLAPEDGRRLDGTTDVSGMQAMPNEAGLADDTDTDDIASSEDDDQDNDKPQCISLGPAASARSRQTWPRAAYYVAHVGRIAVEEVSECPLKEPFVPLGRFIEEVLPVSMDAFNIYILRMREHGYDVSRLVKRAVKCGLEVQGAVAGVHRIEGAQEDLSTLGRLVWARPHQCKVWWPAEVVDPQSPPERFVFSLAHLNALSAAQRARLPASLIGPQWRKPGPPGPSAVGITKVLVMFLCRGSFEWREAEKTNLLDYQDHRTEKEQEANEYLRSPGCKQALRLREALSEASRRCRLQVQEQGEGLRAATLNYAAQQATAINNMERCGRCQVCVSFGGNFRRRCLVMRATAAAASGHEGAQLAVLEEKAVGARVKVLWPLDEAYYEGTVSSFDRLSVRHTILYDDGDVETLPLWSPEQSIRILNHREEWAARAEELHKEQERQARMTLTRAAQLTRKNIDLYISPYELERERNIARNQATLKNIQTGGMDQGERQGAGNKGPAYLAGVEGSAAPGHALQGHPSSGGGLSGDAETGEPAPWLLATPGVERETDILEAVVEVDEMSTEQWVPRHLPDLPRGKRLSPSPPMNPISAIRRKTRGRDILSKRA